MESSYSYRLMKTLWAAKILFPYSNHLLCLTLVFVKRWRIIIGYWLLVPGMCAPSIASAKTDSHRPGVEGENSTSYCAALSTLLCFFNSSYHVRAQVRLIEFLPQVVPLTVPTGIWYLVSGILHRDPKTSSWVVGSSAPSGMARRTRTEIGRVVGSPRALAMLL